MFYKAKKTHGFDSKAEQKQYICLLKALHSGKITDLQRQVRYRLEINGIHICDYIADFEYKDCEGKKHVLDVKGFTTAGFRLKRKLMEAIHGIKIKCLVNKLKA